MRRTFPVVRNSLPLWTIGRLRDAGWERPYHYVYRITNIKEGMHYYGVRTSKKYTPAWDLGLRYFSSSGDKWFQKDQRDNPDDYSYKIVRMCKTREIATVLEKRLHDKYLVGQSESFYNIKGGGYDKYVTGQCCTERRVVIKKYKPRQIEEPMPIMTINQWTTLSNHKYSYQ